MKRKGIIIGIVLVAIVAGYFVFGNNSKAADSEILVTAQKGEFLIDITVSGELEAKNSVQILGPNGLRAARLWNVKIDDLIAEGTVVKKGDYIASLDKSELADRIRNEENELQQSMSKYTQTQLDTALELRQTRDDLINLKFAVVERELILEQSQFEPPATIKQEEINLEKANRAYDQARKNYQLKKRRAVAQMQEAAAKMAEDQNEFDFLQRLSQEFIIKAPEAGMVIYQREYNGKKKGKGSSIGAWDPTVATLPDLTTMLSKTYVNEVDIRKVKSGQKVNIGLDAFPEKKLTGKVVSVANVGEQKPNSDAKVFEVSIEVNEVDTTLRPAMTTSNAIIADVMKDVIFLPLECLHNQGDSLTYVYKREGMTTLRQEVEIGKANANEAVILRGIEAGDRIFLSIPKENGNEKFVPLEDTGADLSALKR